MVRTKIGGISVPTQDQTPKLQRMNELPLELLESVFVHLDTKSLASCCAVSKFWNRIGTPILYKHISVHSANMRARLFKHCEDNRLPSSLRRQRTDSAIDVRAPPNHTYYRSTDSAFKLVRGFSFGLTPTPEAETCETERYGSDWRQRFVSTFISSLSEYMPNIQRLDLSGCQFYDTILGAYLDPTVGGFVSCGRPHLTHLSVAFSSIREPGLVAVADSCGATLEYIDLSGLFRFARIDPNIVGRLLDQCTQLQTVVLADSPDFWCRTSLVDSIRASYPYADLLGESREFPNFPKSVSAMHTAKLYADRAVDGSNSWSIK